MASKMNFLLLFLPRLLCDLCVALHNYNTVLTLCNALKCYCVKQKCGPDVSKQARNAAYIARTIRYIYLNCMIFPAALRYIEITIAWVDAAELQYARHRGCLL